MARDTKKRMTHAAVDLIRRQGYRGTGLNEIVATAQAPKGSLYFHFPDGKVQLAAEAADAFATLIIRLLQDCLAGSATAADGFDRFLEDMGKHYESTAFADGCVIATMTLEAAAQEPRLQQACDAAIARWVEVLAARLVADGFSPADADARASLAIAVMEGSHVLIKAEQRNDRLDEIRPLVHTLLTAPS